MGLALLIAGATFIAFLPSLSNPFIRWDDARNIVGNFHLRSFDAANVRWMLTAFHLGHYTPLAWLSLALDYKIWGLNPFGFHLHSLLLHIANALLFYVLSRRLLKVALPALAADSDSNRNWAAAASAMLFALHPLRVESVAWATERRDVLSGFFFLLSLLAYTRYRDPAAAKKRGVSYGLCLISYALSCSAKTYGIGLPIVLWMLDIYPYRILGGKSGWFTRSTLPLWLEKLPFLLLAAPFSYMALSAQLHGKVVYTLSEIGPLDRVAIAGYSALFYLQKMVWPTHLSAMYELPYAVHWTMPQFIHGLAGLMVVSLACFILVKRWPVALSLWLSYLVLLSPVSGLAQSGAQIVADRYSYLPCMTWELLAGGGVGLLLLHRPRWRAPLGGALLVIAALLTTMTYRQTQVWHDTHTLWTHSYQSNPRAIMSRYYLGSQLIDEKNYAEAHPILEGALAIEPKSDEVLTALGRLAFHEGRLPEAITYYEKALAINPNNRDAHLNYGLVELQQNQPAAAADHFQKVLYYDPASAEAHVNLGIAFAMQNRLDDAIEQFTRALQIDPDLTAAQTNLARALSIRPPHAKQKS